jgi:formylglycine-generating enzyme required for sulfatase activity
LGSEEAAYLVARPTAGASSSSFLATLPRDASRQTPPNREFRLPSGFAVVESQGYDPSGIPRQIQCEVDGSVMVLVPAGAFLQGTDGGPADAAPEHASYVDGFYIDRFETTLRQYAQFRQANAAKRPQTPLNGSDPEDHPALGVSWRDATSYARWVGKDLPTEAEWEKAGRTDRGFQSPWGDGRPLWRQPRRPGQIDSVGSHPEDQSLYGVFDLAGNADEWCSDWYSADAYREARTADGSPVRNPRGPARASPPNARVVKGAGTGGWHLWARRGVNMKETLPLVGFRCVLRVAIPEAAASATGPAP